MAPIVLSNVSKSYRGCAEAVRDVSLTIPDGACCAILGPTGSGKSTLLRLMASREAPTSGLVEIGETVSQSWRLRQPDAAELIDARALDGRRNVYDAMSAGLRRRGLARAEAEAATLRAADRLGLGPLMARRIATISGGEAALAALGRAFAHRPEALLLDEPFTGLDAARRLELRRALRKLGRETGVTIVAALHDVTDALALADMLVVMDDGRVIVSGAPQEIYARPANVEVARLVGAPPMNLLPVRANQTGLSLEDGTHLGGASVMTGAVFSRLGVRPEDLFAMLDGAPPAAAVFPVTVDEVEKAGPETFVHGRVGAFPIVARLVGPAEPPAAGPFRLGARRDSLHMFDAQTGERV